MLVGGGVARTLLDYALTFAVARGFEFVRLEVRLENRAAIALYGNAGFASVARIASYYGLGEDGLRMERSVGGGVT